MWEPSFQSVVRADGSRACRVGHPLVDEFLDFVAGRARPNTVVAYAYDLVVFFGLVGKVPAEVTTRDVLAFIATQQRPRGDGNVESPRVLWRLHPYEEGWSPWNTASRIRLS